ncbi:MAG: hypothetical protein GF313_07020 [Caldithrix sp.]|nr:hypothetical protein [Caldithrix sp.]
MHKKNIETIIENLKKTVKDFKMKDGDMFSITDEHHRVHVSPYRITMEIRFPEGIDKIED